MSESDEHMVKASRLSSRRRARFGQLTPRLAQRAALGLLLLAGRRETSNSSTLGRPHLHLTIARLSCFTNHFESHDVKLAARARSDAWRHVGRQLQHTLTQRIRFWQLLRLDRHLQATQVESPQDAIGPAFAGLRGDGERNVEGMQIHTAWRGGWILTEHDAGRGRARAQRRRS